MEPVSKNREECAGAPAMSPYGGAALKRKRRPVILAVDDDTQMLALLRNLLIGLDYEIAIAESGAAALGLFDSIDPDLVLTDLCMASGDGYELIDFLRRKRRLLPILAMSGVVLAPAALAFARKIGADDVIQKPFLRSQIVELIDRHLRRP